jgi:hypothetical protein
VRCLLLCTGVALLLNLGCGQDAPPEPVDALRPPKHITLDAPEIQLLPFTMRLSKLSHVLERPISDPLFDTLIQQRFALGDHNYARALRPDRRWSARKMGIWIKSLLPICESDRFAELYPAVAESPDALVIRAYGRTADMADHMAVFDILESMDADANADVTVCLALLTSLEFVVQ